MGMLHACGFHCVITDFVQRRVLRMVVFQIRVVAGGVVAKQNRPPAVLRTVLVRAVHHIRMKKQTVTRLKFGIHQFHGLEHLLHTARVCPDLFSR